MAKTIAVLGATGNQGGSVAKHFLHHGWHVIGLTRSATSSSAQALKSQGVELAEADVDHPDSLVPAFSRAEVVFAMTDFWATFSDAYPELLKISDRATGEHAFEVELQRGKNIVDATAQANESSGKLERLVFSLLPSFTKQSGGKYTYAYHFDSKAEVADYLREKKSLWEKSSILNMGFYTSNLVTYGEVMGGAKALEGGKYIYRIIGTADALHPFVDTDDTGRFVDLLVRSPPKQDLLGVSVMDTFKKYMEVWSEVTGVPSAVMTETVDDADKGTPGGLGREAAESVATSAEFGWGENLVMPKDLDPQIELTSLKAALEKENWKVFLSKLTTPK